MHLNKPIDILYKPGYNVFNKENDMITALVVFITCIVISEAMKSKPRPRRARPVAKPISEAERRGHPFNLKYLEDK